ncbi:MAG: 3-dehydroquinate synthase [Acuticoccus sp.]
MLTSPQVAATLTAPAATRVRVPLGERAYDVVIGAGLIDRAGALIGEARTVRRAMIVTDDVVGPIYLARLTASLEAAGIATQHHTVAHGEASKSAPVLLDLVDTILDAALERGDAIVALGGGVVGDLAGFAAAIVRRGMPFVQVPTSLLAQVDSAVGGKTGINARQGKNLVGAFHQPALVLADTDTLDTLSPRERRAGYAEIVKAGLILDAAFFARLEALGADAPMRDIAASIARAVEIKADVVMRDEEESGVRALLNLGHTFAHAIERIAGYDGRIVHGEAVGLGICLAYRLSARLGLASTDDAARVTAHIAAVGLPTTFADIAAVRCVVSEVQEGMTQDKKVKNGVIRFILTRGIGAAFVSDGVDPTTIGAFLQDEGLPSS